jgi:hypothetical protein
MLRNTFESSTLLLVLATLSAPALAFDTCQPPPPEACTAKALATMGEKFRDALASGRTEDAQDHMYAAVRCKIGTDASVKH